jgi:hypothetical protein
MARNGPLRNHDIFCAMAVDLTSKRKVSVRIVDESTPPYLVAEVLELVNRRMGRTLKCVVTVKISTVETDDGNPLASYYNLVVGFSGVYFSAHFVNCNESLIEVLQEMFVQCRRCTHVVELVLSDLSEVWSSLAVEFAGSQDTPSEVRVKSLPSAVVDRLFALVLQRFTSLAPVIQLRVVDETEEVLWNYFRLVCKVHAPEQQKGLNTPIALMQKMTTFDAFSPEGEWNKAVLLTDLVTYLFGTSTPRELLLEWARSPPVERSSGVLEQVMCLVRYFLGAPEGIRAEHTRQTKFGEPTSQRSNLC